ncbi:MAG: hypothetical protein QOI42_1731 [Frankiaceae bacterium]|nr:hypothetical protein [Frankiaceae bacterium]
MPPPLDVHAHGPRWAGVRDAPRVARLIRQAFGGRPLVQLAKAVVVPHLVVSSHGVLLGVVPDDGRRPVRTSRRLLDCVVHVGWLAVSAVVRPMRRRIPWALRRRRNARWRLTDLARDVHSPASASYTWDVCLWVLALADAVGMEVEAEVDEAAPRLANLYRRYGFVDAAGDGFGLLLRRAPVLPPEPSVHVADGTEHPRRG